MTFSLTSSTFLTLEMSQNPSFPWFLSLSLSVCLSVCLSLSLYIYMMRIVISLINPTDFLQGDLKDKKSYKLRKTAEYK